MTHSMAWEKQMTKMGLTKYNLAPPPLVGEDADKFERDGMSKAVEHVLRKGPLHFASADREEWEACAPWVAREGARHRGFCDEKRKMAEQMTPTNADHIFPMMRGVGFIAEMAWLARHGIDEKTRAACGEACDAYRTWLRKNAATNAQQRVADQ